MSCLSFLWNESVCFLDFNFIVYYFVEHLALYGTPTYNKTCHIDAIERVQRRAARFVTNKYRNTFSVGNMLQHLEWRSLQDRRYVHAMYN
jgi:hypothetical protein